MLSLSLSLASEALWPSHLWLLKHTPASTKTLTRPASVSCITSGNLWLISLFLGGEAKRECKWVQTAGAFLVARSDGGPQGLAHQPLVLLPLFRQKPTGEKAGRPLRQRDQMVREVKSVAHSVSATLSVTWATVLMPVQPTGVRWAWGAVLLCRPPLWGEIGLPVNHTLSHVYRSVSWLLPSGLWPGSICLESSSNYATSPCTKINVDLYVMHIYL